MITGALKTVIRILTCILPLLANSVMSNESIQSTIMHAEIKEGLPKGLLLAVAKTESKLQPWTMNIDGISVFLDSKKQAIEVLKAVASTHRYGVQGMFNGEYFAGFYQTETEAFQKSQQLAKTNNLIRINQKDFIKVNPIYTDVCVMQINYRYHGTENFNNVNEMFDQSKCIYYAASFLSKLIKKHGIKKGVGCYNGCSAQSISSGSTQKYANKVLSAWNSNINISFRD